MEYRPSRSRRTVPGALTINGATFSLRYAYASAKPGFFDKDKEDIHVLLSDVPLTDEQQADVFEIIHLAGDGKAHVVEVVLDAEQRPIAGSFFTVERSPIRRVASATISLRRFSLRPVNERRPRPRS